MTFIYTSIVHIQTAKTSWHMQSYILISSMSFCNLQTVLCFYFSHNFDIVLSKYSTHTHTHTHGDRGSTVVKVLHYKSEGHWFDPRWCHWNFSLT
jgi:hypothetical protein